jgi:hypothetical protein
MTEDVRRSPLVDWLLIGLAMLSVVLVAYSVLGDLQGQQRMVFFYIDCGICAVFLAEFLWSWHGADWRRHFLIRNWYDVLGMIPVAHPSFLDGGWTGLLWVLVVLARIGRAADRVVGERITAALTQRASVALVGAIRQPLTVAILDDVADVLQSGHYSRNLAAALLENQAELTVMIREKLEQDRLTGRVSLVPFHESLIDTVTETTLRVVFAVLADPRTDELIADVLRENIEQLREQVRAKAYGSGQGPTAFGPRDDIPGLLPRRPGL